MNENEALSLWKQFLAGSISKEDTVKLIYHYINLKARWFDRLVNDAKSHKRANVLVAKYSMKLTRLALSLQ